MNKFDTNYFEEYARLTLVDLFPWGINLEHKDKPDLQNEIDNIGLEVTSSTPENIRKTESYGSERLGKIITPNEMQKFNGEFFYYPDEPNRVHAYSSTKGLITPNTCYDVQRILEIKKNKQTNYRNFATNGIYIFTGNIFADNNHAENISKIKECDYFDLILLNCLDVIYCITGNDITTFNVPNSDLKRYKTEALKYSYQVSQH